jgi:hypothetical protein
MGENRADEDGYTYREHKQAWNDEDQRERHGHAEHNENDSADNHACVLKQVDTFAPKVSSHGNLRSITRAKSTWAPLLHEFSAVTTALAGMYSQRK